MATIATRPLSNGSIADARAAMDAGEVSAAELAEQALAVAGEHADDAIFIHLTASAARVQAAEADRSARARGPLHGIPVTVKNNLDVAGLPTTCGSPVFADRLATSDAEVVRRLRAAGAVVVGTTNLHEMAFGSTSVNPHTGAVANPRAPGHVAGGSSGGSAAAVALGIGFASLGTDAAGSIRMPASCCGVVGLKPTHGTVPLRGMVPTSMTHVDHIGPLTTSVADARLLLDVIAGPGPGQATPPAWTVSPSGCPRPTSGPDWTAMSSPCAGPRSGASRPPVPGRRPWPATSAS
ncbi:amidase [Pseudonocardia benzenivorans]